MTKNEEERRRWRRLRRRECGGKKSYRKIIARWRSRE